MSNSTQNDEIKQMERAINEGFAESEKFLKGMKTPFDKSSTQNDEIEVDGETYVKWDTQNDWEVRFNDRFLNNWGTLLDIKHFIRKELADARKEVIEEIEKMLWSIHKDEVNDENINWNESLSLAISRLATLKEETL